MKQNAGVEAVQSGRPLKWLFLFDTTVMSLTDLYIILFRHSRGNGSPQQLAEARIQ
jgi:hypothetical protein